VRQLYGRLAGTDPAAGELWAGSHLDTVPNGGRFDGALGVLAALEAVARLRDAPRAATLCVAVFRDEEGWRFGQGCFGSRCLCGTVNEADLQATDAEGVSIVRRWRRRYPEPLGGGTLPAAFVEVHIEQGPVLSDGGWRTRSSPRSRACPASRDHRRSPGTPAPRPWRVAGTPCWPPPSWRRARERDPDRRSGRDRRRLTIADARPT
jgi:hypothetical protein